jgi:hypothetical protein
VTDSEGTDLIGDPTSLTSHAKKFGRSQSVTPNSQVMRRKPSFAEFLHKYQRIYSQAKEK